MCAVFYGFKLYICASFTVNVLYWFTGDQPGADLGPLISPEAKKRVCELVQSGVDEGASVSDCYSVVVCRGEG